MSRVLSLRLKDEQIERLGRVGRRWGRTPSETAALLLEESLRQEEFPYIEFRDTAAGRTTYLKGTRIAVWLLATHAEAHHGDTSKVAADLEIPEAQVKGALAYAAAYPAEIEAVIEDNHWVAEHIEQLIPGVIVWKVDAAAP